MSDRIFTQIKDGKHVDFDCLLANLEGAKTKKGYEFALSEETGGQPVVHYTSTVHSDRHVNNFHTWCRVWTTFLEICSYFHPHLTEKLIRYQSIIVRFAGTFKDYAWINYDNMFRAKVALTCHLQWDSEDSRLYNKVLKGNEKLVLVKSQSRAPAHTGCFKCGKPGHIAKFCHGRENTENVCFRFNSVGGCTFSPCVFSCKCRICGGGHPAPNCTVKGGR